MDSVPECPRTASAAVQQHHYLKSGATTPARTQMRAGAWTTIWNDDNSSAVKRGGVFDRSKTVATTVEKGREPVQGIAGTGGGGGGGSGGGGGDGGAEGGEVHDNNNIFERTNSSLRRHSVDSRVCQHVDRFVKRIGRPVAEGRHLAQLLQVQ